MGVNDKVRTDLDLHKGSNLEMGVYAIERSYNYTKVGVDQIWKQFLKQLKNYAHLWKLKHCANTDAVANDWVTTEALQGHSPSELIISHVFPPLKVHQFL